MAAPQTHIIARYGMELDFQDRQAARGVSEDLLDASRRYIALLIDECCSELVQPDQYVTIPRLEIDLGTLDLNDLVGDFLEKFRAQLRTQLQTAISSQGPVRQEDRALDVIAQYGITGQYPWWAGSPAPTMLLQAVSTLLRLRDSMVHRQLRDVLDQPNVLRRLVLALPAEQVAALWEIMAALQPPIRGQATIEAMTDAILKSASQLDRMQWQGFAYKAIAQTVPSLQLQVDGGQYSLLLQTETDTELPAVLLERLEQVDEFVALVAWLQHHLQPPLPLLAAYLVGLANAGSSSRAAAALEAAMSDLSAWLRMTWKVGSDRTARLFTAIGNAYATGQPAAKAAAPDVADQLTQWLRTLLDAPDGRPAALLARLAAAQQAAQPDSAEAPTVQRLQHWLKAQYAVSEAAAALIAQALLPDARAQWRARPQRAVTLDAILPTLRTALAQPEAAPATLIAQLAAQFDSTAPTEQPTLQALNQWLQATLKLNPQETEVLAQALLPEAIARFRTRSVAPVSMEALTPILRSVLQQPRASAGTLIAQLAAQYDRAAPAAEPTFDGLMTWLRSNFGIASDDRQQVAATLLPEVIARWRARTPAIVKTLDDLLPVLRKLLAAPEMSLPAALAQLAARIPLATWPQAPTSASLTEWLQTLAGLQPAALPLLVAELLPEALARWQARGSSNPQASLTPHIPWLRAALALPQAKGAALLTALQARFAADFPTTALTVEAIAEWLPSLGTILEADAVTVATALLQHAGPSHRTADKEPFPELVRMRTWLRRKLDLPKADTKMLVAALLEQFQAKYPGAAPQAILLEDWLDTQLQLPKAKRAVLAKAMVTWARETRSQPTGESPTAKRELPPRPPSPRLEVPYFVENAGLILFWPFLQRFFQFQGLVDDKQFVSVMAQEQAVRLLQTLVMPDGEWNEAALALPKLLCGLPPDALVDPYVPVETEQLEAVEELIAVVLAHWTLAGDLSADGFRQAWLQRSGTLRIRDDHWLLRVETMGHDMILEGLPWELAYVQLPWMRHVLYVDWAEKAKFNA